MTRLVLIASIAFLLIPSLASTLMTSSKVSTRFQKWPYRRNVDDTFEPYGFKEAWHILNKIYNNLSINKK